MNQNKISKLFVGVLLVINIISIVIIWILVSKAKEPPFFDKNGPPPSPVEMFSKELNFTEEQTKQFDMMYNEHRKETDKVFDQMDKLREQLSSYLISSEGEDQNADSVIYKIGQLQMKAERMRYNHFKELISLCTPEQKDKLKPILSRILSNKMQGGKPEDGHKFHD